MRSFRKFHKCSLRSCQYPSTTNIGSILNRQFHPTIAQNDKYQTRKSYPSKSKTSQKANTRTDSYRERSKRHSNNIISTDESSENRTFWGEGKGSNTTQSKGRYLDRDQRVAPDHYEKDSERAFLERLSKLESLQSAKQHNSEPEQSPQTIIGKKKLMDQRTKAQLDEILSETMRGLNTLEKDEIFQELEGQMRVLEEDIWNEFRSSGDPLNAFTLNHVQSVIGQSKEDIYDFYRELSREEMAEMLQQMRNFERANPIQNSPLNSFFKKISGRDIASHEITEDELQRFFKIIQSDKYGGRLKRQLKKLLPDEVIRSFGYDPELLKKEYGDDTEEEDKGENAKQDHDDIDIEFQQDFESSKDIEDEVEDDDLEELTYEQIKQRMREHNNLMSMNRAEVSNQNINTDEADKSLQEYIKENNLHEEVEKIQNRNTESKSTRQVNNFDENDDLQYYNTMNQDLFNLDLGAFQMNQMEDYQVDNWKHLMRKQFEEDPHMKELFEKEFGTDTDEMINSFAESMLRKK